MTKTPVVAPVAFATLYVLIAWCSALGWGCGGSSDLTMAPTAPARAGLQDELPPPLVSGRLPEWAAPLRYALRLDLDPNANAFTGEVAIEVSLARPSRAIVLHAAELNVTRAEVVRGDTVTRIEATMRAAAGATTEKEELVLIAPSELEPGTMTFRLEYTAPLTDQLRGIYRTKDDDKAYVFTLFEPSDARRMFPCFDDPIYKVPFDVAVTVPAGNVVMANTPEKERKDAPDGKKTTFRFETTPPLPTYLVALAAGPLEVRQGPTSPVPIRVVTVAGKAKLGDVAIQIAVEHLAIMAEMFGSPYPYKKLDLVAVPNFGPGAMENAGLVTFREELILLDEASASAKSRRDVATVLAHELSHQWFGNLVTMKWWDDLWLNEGFATYMEALVVDRWRPSMRAGLEMHGWSGWVMDYDALDSARAVRQPVSNTYQAIEAFDGITYVKGASVLRMLHRWLGDQVFEDGVRRYLADHAWQNASAADLFAALGKASGQDVASVASSFLDRSGVPIVQAVPECGKGAPRVQLSQRRYRPRAGEAKEAVAWKIPVCLTFGTKAAGPPKRACTLLSERQATLVLEGDRCPAWVLPNAGYDGYYRFALDEANMDALAVASKSTTDKIGFVANLWALVRSGDVPASKLLGHLVDLEHDREREVVDQIIAVLHKVSDALVTDAARPSFEAYVAALLLPTAKRLGWDNRPKDIDDDKLLRRSVLEALAQLTRDPWVATEAKLRAAAYLKDSGSVAPDTAAIALMVAARRGDVGYKALVAALPKASTPGGRVALVQALGSVGKADDLRGALELVRGGTVRAQDALYILRSAVEWPDSRAVLIDWLSTNLAELAARYPGFGADRMIGALSRICDPAARAAAERAFTPIAKQIGASDRRLAESLEEAQLCIDLRGRQAAAASAFLGKKHW